MREIKFRAWHTVNKVMYEHKSIPVLLKNVNNSDSVWVYMQFSGLLDKHNNPIYEGDVMYKKVTDYESEAFNAWQDSNYEGNQPDDSYKNMIDVCDLSHFRYWLKKESFGYEGEDLETPGDWEIVGNIHEHPHLLNT